MGFAGAAHASLSSDPLLQPYLGKFVVPEFPVTERPFAHLFDAILSQQLSGKAANTIIGRVVALAGGAEAIVPERLIALTEEELRSCGASGAKARAIHDLSRHCLDGSLPLDKLSTMSDLEVEKALVQVKGIGQWSAHMFLIFALNRPDVWPVGDLAVRKGVAKIFGREDLPPPKEMTTLGERWTPYRTAIAHLTWHISDQI